MRACKWIGVKILLSSGMPTWLSLGSVSLVLDLTMKKGVDLPCTNWSGAGLLNKIDVVAENLKTKPREPDSLLRAENIPTLSLR